MASKEDVYGAFVDYYGDLLLGLVKSSEGWVVYGAKIYSGLNQHRYLFIVVPEHMAPGQKANLDQLDWVSFQTRTTDDIHQVPTHHLYLDDKRKQVLSDKIMMVERINEETHYVTDSLPIKIRLLHDPKKNNHLQYPDQAFLYQALDTYRCVVELL